MQSFKDLLIWKKGMELTKLIYQITKKFSSDEKYGLISQMRRSSSSIPANIAEGWGRRSDKSFLYYLNMSKGSLVELHTHVLLSFELNYISKIESDMLENKIEELGKMIHSFQNCLA